MRLSGNLAIMAKSARGGEGNTPAWIRTRDPLLRRQVLYPPELRVLIDATARSIR